jgi:hypothetical protein
MFDLNAIVNAALQQAVAEAVAPLLERITALENNPAQGVDTEMDLRVGVLAQRVTALEERPAVHIDEAKMVEALNSQEWFWEKLRRTTDAQIEQAMEEHTSTYDHDDYDSHISDDDKHFEGDLDDAVRDTVRNMTFEVTLS